MDRQVWFLMNNEEYGWLDYPCVQTGDLPHDYHGHLKNCKLAQEHDFLKLYIFSNVSKKYISFTCKFTI